MSKTSEIRSKWWSRPLGHIIWFFITSVCLTLRKRVEIQTPDPADPAGSRPVIVAIWHNRIFIPCYVYKYIIKGKTGMSMLTSASKDGAILGTVAEDYGMRAVRGSSGRRGVAGFLDMLREVRAGYCMCITPDGPKGPIYKSHPGVIKLASVSGVPIVPVAIDYYNCWRVKSWDGFAIPKPFSRVGLRWGTPIEVPEGLDDEGIKAYSAKLDAALAVGRPDFEPLFPES